MITEERGIISSIKDALNKDTSKVDDFREEFRKAETGGRKIGIIIKIEKEMMNLLVAIRRKKSLKSYFHDTLNSIGKLLGISSPSYNDVVNNLKQELGRLSTLRSKLLNEVKNKHPDQYEKLTDTLKEIAETGRSAARRDGESF